MAEEDLKAIGKRITELRNKSGLSIRDLAEICEISKTVISGLEKHGRDVRYSTLDKIAKALGITVFDLLDKNSYLYIMKTGGK